MGRAVHSQSVRFTWLLALLAAERVGSLSGERVFRGNELIISIAPPCAGKSDWFQSKRPTTSREKAEWYPPPEVPVLEVAIDKNNKIYKEVPQEDAVYMAAAACLNSKRLCEESIYDLDTHSGPFHKQDGLVQAFAELERLGHLQRERILGEKQATKYSVSSVMAGEQAIVLLCLLRLLSVAQASYLLRREVMRIGMEIANPLPKVNSGRKKIVGMQVVALADEAVLGLRTGFKMLAQRKEVADQETMRRGEAQENKFEPLVDAGTVHVYQPVALPSAIGQAIDTLEEALMRYDGLVAWGNTNTRIRDFQVALTAAAKYQRPVRFVVWGRELPSAGLGELMQRNVARFASEGKYIPVGRIHSARVRCERMLKDACGRDLSAYGLDLVGLDRWKHRHDSSEVAPAQKRMAELDASIARLAGFSMDGNTRLIRAKRNWKA